VQNSSRLALYHYWVAFAAFLPAVVLGAWQMLMRSPLPAPLDDPNAYYTSVTLHGTAMAYVLTTFFAMGFGYAVAATSLGRPVRGVAAAWIGFVICLIGTLMAVVSVVSGRATVLYTFYPPLLGYGIHGFCRAWPRAYPMALSSNLFQPARMVFGPGGL
jgi:cytochrome c oxidase subunit 1